MDEAARRAHALGRKGEEIAARDLAARGFEILERNVRLPAAEIDLVARDRHGLVFVEVKTRSSARHGAPYQAVNDGKRARMEQAALDYIAARQLGEVDFRLGVMSVLLARDGRLLGVEWIEEA
ncbi:MAG: YraN family protein [Planctomycetes bacterium]|nr:YraN family protein [Planctomycetota bacterium]